jgi:hypothetical protein
MSKWSNGLTPISASSAVALVSFTVDATGTMKNRSLLSFAKSWKKRSSYTKRKAAPFHQ